MDDLNLPAKESFGAQMGLESVIFCPLQIFAIQSYALLIFAANTWAASPFTAHSHTARNAVGIPCHSERPHVCMDDFEMPDLKMHAWETSPAQRGFVKSALIL